jgi:hypothetical protein
VTARGSILASAILAAVASSAGCGSCGDKGERAEGEAVDGSFGVAWDGGGRRRRMHGGRGRFAEAGEAPPGNGNPVDAGAPP